MTQTALFYYIVIVPYVFEGSARDNRCMCVSVKQYKRDQNIAILSFLSEEIFCVLYGSMLSKTFFDRICNQSK